MGAASSKTEIYRPPPVPKVGLACAECGGIFTFPANYARSERSRCARCAARVAEQKVASSPYSRKCGACQVLFNVSQSIAELPLGVMVNCQRCSDTHRELITSGLYIEVTLQKGEESLYIHCPKRLEHELKRCMLTCKEQGYIMTNNNSSAR